MLMPFDHVDELVKAKLYVEDPSGFVWVDEKTVVWMSTGTSHLLVCIDGKWHCDCFYDVQSHLPCGHVRALEQLARERSGSACSVQSKSLPDLVELAPAGCHDWDRRIPSILTLMPRR
jgi:hypothetical protein